MTFAKILVPYDTSEYSNKALEKAVEIAQKFNSRIIIIYVIQDIQVPPMHILKPGSKNSEETAYSTYFKELYEQIKKDMYSIIEAKIKQFSDSGLSLDKEVRVGSPADTIVEFAETNDVDLVVIGSKGLTGISKVFKGMGSVSRNVSERVSCPILIVR